MSARVLYVGLDACDARLMETLVSEGKCPNIARLLREGAAVPTIAPYGTFVGSSWMTISTGRDPARHGYWNWLEIDPASGTHRETTPRDARGEPFWQRIDAAGKRVAVLDVPHMDIPGDAHGVYLKEWGCHDRHDGTASYPEGLLGDLDRLVGRHPIGCRDHPGGLHAFAPCDYTLRAGPHRTMDEERQLADLIRMGVDAKHRATAHLLDKGSWDLFVTVFGESHCVGHQFWHVHDAGHPRHHPPTRRLVGDPVTEIYERLDAAIGDLIDRAGPETAVYVQMNHGMGPHFDGDHLLGVLLSRIDAALSGEHRPGHASRAARFLLRVVPRLVRRPLLRVAAAAARLWARRGMPRPSRPSAPDHHRRWYQIPGNTSVGAVRCNMAGRDAGGKVAPGREYERSLRALERALLDVVDIDTGRPLVRRLVRVDEIHERTADDLLPDVFVEWNRDTLIERVWSPLTGTVVARYAHWRTGDHHDEGMLIASGPGIVAGRRRVPMALVDVAPTLAAAAGVEMPEVDGAVHLDLLPEGVEIPRNPGIPKPPTHRLVVPRRVPARERTSGRPGMAAAALDHAALVDRRAGEAIAALRQQIVEMAHRMNMLERERTVWATMAWLAHEPVRDDVTVSVITPTYRRPEALGDAIGSVLAQRHQRWEMLIVDDGSHTAREVVTRIGDPRVRVFDADHGGACSARNVALGHVRGDLVTYLDDDNLLDPGWLHAVAWAFGNHPEASVLYGARIIDDVLRVHRAGEGGWPWMHFRPYDRQVLEENNFADMGVIAHRAGLPARFDESLVECGDWDFLLALTQDSVPLELPAIAVYYRTNRSDHLTGQEPADVERVRRKWAKGQWPPRTV